MDSLYIRQRFLQILGDVRAIRYLLLIKIKKYVLNADLYSLGYSQGVTRYIINKLVDEGLINIIQLLDIPHIDYEAIMRVYHLQDNNIIYTLSESGKDLFRYYDQELFSLVNENKELQYIISKAKKEIKYLQTAYSKILNEEKNKLFRTKINNQGVLYQTPTLRNKQISSELYKTLLLLKQTNNKNLVLKHKTNLTIFNSSELFSQSKNVSSNTIFYNGERISFSEYEQLLKKEFSADNNNQIGKNVEYVEKESELNSKYNMVKLLGLNYTDL